MNKNEKTALVPKLRFPEFCNAPEWEEKKLGDFFDFLPTANNSKADLSDSGDTFYVHYGDIHTKFNTYLDFSQKIIIPKIKSAMYKNAATLKNGDLILANASEDTDGIGKSVEVKGLSETDKAISGLHTILIRDSKNNFANGFKGLLTEISSIKNQLERLAVGTKVYSLSKTVLKQVVLFFPSLLEQQKIAACLSSLDELITVQAKKIEALKLHKKGLMQGLFVGGGE